MGGSAPRPQPQLPPPVTPVDPSIQEARRRYRRRALGQQGIASQILTGPYGANQGAVSGPTLLGGPSPILGR